MNGPKVFLLSPANCSGGRAQILLREQASFDLAQALRTEAGVPLADVFSFLSGLYFRGKIVYSRRFVTPLAETPGIFVITAGRGLMSVDTPVRSYDLQQFASVPVDVKESRYRDPLERDIRKLATQLPQEGQVILLGSVATNKYIDILAAGLGDRLRFPREFLGRGDLSRGGLLLRSVREGRELEYDPISAILPREKNGSENKIRNGRR